MMESKLKDYEQELLNQELAPNTIKKYVENVRQLEKYIQGKGLTKANLISFKDDLTEQYKTNTINNKIVTINKYLDYLGLEDLKLKQVRQQSQSNLDNVMNENEFERVLRQARQKGIPRDEIMLLSLYYTGLRVSELQFLTVEALRKGHITVNNKGKIRKVPISNKLRKTLREYAKDEGLEKGNIIINKEGQPLSRQYIFTRMKWLGGQARVKKAKVYPHSIRHLFAKQWLKTNGNNYLQLADILGHSSLETTRIYSKMSVDEMKETITF